jgi:hypothetical protein
MRKRNVIVGDKVRIIGLPADLPIGDDRLPTRATLEKCLGQTFTISGFNAIGWAELPIESLTGSVGETIWVEPQFPELASG